MALPRPQKQKVEVPRCLAIPHAMSPGPPSASAGIPHPGLPNTNFLPRPRHSKERPAD